MNILILGSGIVGANLAKKLSEQGKNVFLLDDDANELKNLAERFDIKTIYDDTLNPSFYKNFDSNIDCFIANQKSKWADVLSAHSVITRHLISNILPVAIPTSVLTGPIA